MSTAKSIRRILSKSDSSDRQARRPNFERLEDRRLLASDIEHLYDVVHDIASSYISCPATCDDVVQKTVIKVVGRWNKLEPMAKISQNAYLAKATRNTYIDWVRSDNRKAHLVEQVFSTGTGTARGEPVELLIAAEAEENVERWFNDQQGTDGDILRLRREGLTMDQIADELAIPKSTVQYRCQKLMEACFRELRFGET